MDKPRKKGTADPPEPPVLGSRLELRISEVEKKEFRAAARRQGISLSLWLRLSAWQTINEHGGKVKLLDLKE